MNVIEMEWSLALDDAGTTADNVGLFLCKGFTSALGGAAQYWRPYGEAYGEIFDLLSEADKQKVNGLEWKPRHRIFIFKDYCEAQKNVLGPTCVPVFGGLLRHELEHLRQQEAEPDALDVDKVLDRVFFEIDGPCISKEDTNSKPVEVDANAAAAAYLRKRYPKLVPAIAAGPMGQLATSKRPPEIETLLRRSLEFLFVLRPEYEELQGNSVLQKQGLPWSCKRARALWKELIAEANA